MPVNKWAEQTASLGCIASISYINSTNILTVLINVFSFFKGPVVNCEKQKLTTHHLPFIICQKEFMRGL
jgi:hypothetical protein